MIRVGDENLRGGFAYGIGVGHVGSRIPILVSGLGGDDFHGAGSRETQCVTHERGGSGGDRERDGKSGSGLSRQVRGIGRLERTQRRRIEIGDGLVALRGDRFYVADVGVVVFS